MTRSSISLDSKLAGALEVLPEQASQSYSAIKQVVADGSWAVSPDLSSRIADSLLTFSATSSMAQVMRQAAQCYFALAEDVIRSAQLGAGYALLAADSEMAELHEAMRDRASERWSPTD